MPGVEANRRSPNLTVHAAPPLSASAIRPPWITSSELGSDRVCEATPV